MSKLLICNSKKHMLQKTTCNINLFQCTAFRVRLVELSNSTLTTDSNSRAKGWSNSESSRAKSKTQNNWTDTLNLPQTSLPLSLKDGVARAREIKLQKLYPVDELYKWQQSQPRKKQFVLHDGPPYANGDPHVGHALNKITKDVTNRYKLLQGYKVHYIPGWDCHGMPIEQKALEKVKADHLQLKPMDIRKRAKNVAQGAITRQMTAFNRWGVMADWKRQTYLTHTPQFEANQIEVFFNMYEKGYIYQEYMPVYWSPSARSALAEAELEYNDNHISTAIYVKFLLTQLPDTMQQQLGNGVKSYVLFWTTTPWTLPANEAVCYGSNIKYCFAKPRGLDDVYMVCTDFVEKLTQIISLPMDILFSFSGSDLKGSKYLHPLKPSEDLPLLPANHVTVEKGTGLVHTAPAHGNEDFQVAVNNNLSMDCYVDDEGKFMSEAGPDLAGQEVLSRGNNTVLQIFKDNIIQQESYEHSYPYDWRTKQPVILRASKQWFVNTNSIKLKALENLSTVGIHPHGSSQGMVAQLDKRTYWCISRQRAWGVPIPVFYNSHTKEPIITRSTVSHVKSLIAEHGSDCWWTLPVEKLLPKHVLLENGIDIATDILPGRDVFDIWFDSGTTWSSVLQDSDGVADVYLEGLDQFGGWFQSSLLTSVASQDKAPYREIVVHGFAVDEDGKKMSKSVGNVVDPKTVIDGGKDHSADPAYGVDVLRWWAAQAGLDIKVNIGPSVLTKINEKMFKMRKIVRYLLGNLYDFIPEQHEIPHGQLSANDQYMLHLLSKYVDQVTEAYENYNYKRVLFITEKFVNSHISSFYCNSTKDRIYCNHHDSIERRAAQTVQLHMVKAMLTMLAPIVPHFSEEIHQYVPNKHAESVFQTQWFEPESCWDQPQLEQPFDIVFCIRDTFYSLISTTNPVNFDVVVCAKAKLFNEIKTLQEELSSQNSSLTEVLQCSTSSILSRPPLVIPDESMPVEGKCKLIQQDGSVEEHGFLLVVMPSEDFLCKRCRRNTATYPSSLCTRCNDVVGRLTGTTEKTGSSQLNS